MKTEKVEDKAPASGYKTVTEYCDYADSDDIDDGYCDLGGELDLDNMFGAFVTKNHGVIGGDKTVDDYTPEGLEYISGAHGSPKAK